MAALVIGTAQREAMAALRARASAHPVHMPAVLEQLKTQEGRQAHMKRMAMLTVALPTAFMLTFSIDTGHPVGTCRHMSLSATRRGRAPTPAALWMVAEELGFVGGLNACTVWKEDIGDGAVAINVIQPVSVTAPERVA